MRKIRKLFRGFSVDNVDKIKEENEHDHHDDEDEEGQEGSDEGERMVNSSMYGLGRLTLRQHLWLHSLVSPRMQRRLVPSLGCRLLYIYIVHLIIYL